MPNGNIMDYIGSRSILNVDRLALVRLLISLTLPLSLVRQTQVAQCALGLEYLHNYKPTLVHGDIKGVSLVTHSSSPFANPFTNADRLTYWLMEMETLASPTSV
jgi:hypothetical protein